MCITSCKCMFMMSVLPVNCVYANFTSKFHPHVGGARQIPGRSTAAQGLLQWNGRYSLYWLCGKLSKYIPYTIPFHTGNVPAELPKIARVPLIEVWYGTQVWGVCKSVHKLWILGHF